MEKNSYSLQRNTGLIGRYVIQKVLSTENCNEKSPV